MVFSTMEEDVVSHFVIETVLESHAEILTVMERIFSDDCVGCVLPDIQNLKSSFLGIHLPSTNELNTADNHFSCIINQEVVNFVAVPKLNHLEPPSAIGPCHNLDRSVQVSNGCSGIKSSIGLYDCWVHIAVMIVLKGWSE